MSYWPQGRLEDVLHEAADVEHAVVHAEDPLWETWFEEALEAGVDDELARLGRSVIREAFMLHWKELRREQAGWGDGGEAMLDLAVSHPSLAAVRWRALLDGEL
jgi:hypothetical protein